MTIVHLPADGTFEAPWDVGVGAGGSAFRCYGRADGTGAGGGGGGGPRHYPDGDGFDAFAVDGWRGGLTLLDAETQFALCCL